MRQNNDLDPAVAAILGESQFKQQLRRADPTTAAELKRQRARERITLELHPSVVQALRAVAEGLGISPASVCNWLLGHALLQYAAGDLDMSDALLPSNSPRWAAVMDMDDLARRLDEFARRLDKLS